MLTETKAETETETETEAGEAAAPSRSGAPRTLARRIGAARLWFRAFRRTRPFWGGVWLVAGGWSVLKFSFSSMQLIVDTGFGGIAGYLVGGGMILSGLIPIVLPAQRYTFGLIGVVLAVVSLVVSNLGGFLVGMLLGVLGGSMLVGWGAKRPRRRERAAAQAEEGER
ncbi:DUF6114 domain-containing protein [Streptomyces sp. HUAS MG47]|uniref:DUF6114 domain-containing protein n=1 Tax=Streptomyces solicamelliae TaxID=3231716 RepID=UPI003877EA24